MLRLPVLVSSPRVTHGWRLRSPIVRSDRIEEVAPSRDLPTDADLWSSEEAWSDPDEA